MPIESQPSPTLDEAVSLFLLDCKARRFTMRTIEWYQNYLGMFLKWILSRHESGLYLHEITATHIRTYLVHLHERELSSHTQHNAFRCLRRFFNFAVSEELLTVSPLRKVKPPKLEKKILPAFTPAEVKRLLNKCRSAREKALVLCLLDSGARASEFCKLDVGDIDVEQGAVRIRQGKQQKDRQTHIGSQARKALVRYLIQRGRPSAIEPLFTSEKGGRRITPSGLRQVLRRIGKRAEVAHCHPHTFRRSCALWMLRSGASIYVVQRLLGHENLDVLKQYLALVESDVSDAHQKFGPADTNL
jgi:site-specific recombinase XerD